MPRTTPVFVAILSFLLTLVSTVFVLLALTSKSWTRQNYYNNLSNGTNAQLYSQPLCSATRSPFYRCDEPEPQANASYKTATCSLTCHSYKPYGPFTSCLTPATVPGFGQTTNTFTECQAVHYAGNLQIASVVFICFALLLVLVLSVVTVAFSPYVRSGRGREATEDDTTQRTPRKWEHRRRHEHGHDHDHDHHHDHPDGFSRAPTAPYVTTLLLFSLYAGAVLQVFAQYFGVLGLSTYANPTPNDAVSQDMNLVATEWIIDKGLNTYATTAWTSAVVAAMVAGAAFRTPTFTKVL